MAKFKLTTGETKEFVFEQDTPFIDWLEKNDPEHGGKVIRVYEDGFELVGTVTRTVNNKNKEK